ncbi:hypothetical protein F0562_008598 [Nyssa sinensis]|uniref:Uncharacterized protein n=1 Tax=Nyssa sinensis TaxID=561372 RepID=A0A5J5A8D9_9ASTE|nr:hypothetical protein F0562_008598 [Nyssa sinensis]
MQRMCHSLREKKWRNRGNLRKAKEGREGGLANYIDIEGRTLLKVPSYENIVQIGVLTSFAYPLEGVPGENVVATTRLEEC